MKRLLLFSYAFPPMHVQMTAAVLKPMAALAQYGYTVDVVCADSFSPHLPLDASLLPYAEGRFSEIHRLNPPGGWRKYLQNRVKAFAHVPDLMTVLHAPAYEHLMGMDLTRYDAVMTWSPFHSINAVMEKVRRQRKDVRWIAQFSDPWAGNPLEVNRLCKLWNQWHEPRTVRKADWLVHSSAYSLQLMLDNQREPNRANTSVLPHVFNSELYPQRPKARNQRTTLRYVGVLYGRRTPEPLFLALGKLLERRPALRDRLLLELVGTMSPDMLSSPGAQALPSGLVVNIPNVPFLKSLELMYDADILLLIEADIRKNLFLPSKLSDYLGSRTPVIGMVPPGGSEDAMVYTGSWHARPSDVNEIARLLEIAIDHVEARQPPPWHLDRIDKQYSGNSVASKFDAIIRSL